MSQLKEYFSYKKFADDKLKIVFLDKSYFLQQESITELRKLGHTVVPLPVVDEPKQMLDNLLKTCLKIKPDFILGTNHIGFDPDGKIAAVLADLEIPVAFWYLDDFRFIIPDARQQAQPNIAVFTFGKTDLDSLRQFGFEHVFYLPAGSTLEPNTNWQNAKYAFLNERITFVGNTFMDAQERWLQPHYPGLYDQLNLHDWDIQQKSLVDFIKKEQEANFSTPAELYHFAGYVAGRSTMENRIKILEQVQKPVVYGDRHWPTLGLDVEIHPPVHMTKETPKIFNAAQINLNISSTQLTTSVNQRVFDAPLAGGFLLSDWRESLAELFEVKKELAIYRSVEELHEKIDFYQNNESARHRVIQAAAKRIEKEHLLIYRMQELVGQMKNTFS